MSINLKSFLFSALLLASTLMAAPVWIFNKPNTTWREPYGITLQQDGNALLLNVTKPDCRIVARKISIPCSQYGYMRIRYRAEGFGGTTNGELFYGTDKAPGISGSRYIPIGSLITDGKPHDLVLDVKRWRNNGTVNILRLDLVNQAPGRVWLEKIEFLPNNAKIVEERDATLPADWPQKVKTEFRAKLPKRPVFIEGAYFTAQMCNYPGRGEVIESGYARQVFNLDFIPDRATLQIAADDFIQEIYVNGQAIRGYWTSTWRDINIVNVKRFLKKGQNLLAVRYGNTGALGGVVYELSASTAKGNYLVVNSGRETKMGFNVPANWYNVDFKDGAWKPAETRACPPAAPWTGYKLAYRDMRPVRGNVTFADFKVTNAEHPESLSVNVTLKAEPALADDEIVLVKVLTKQGRIIHSKRATIKDFKPVRNTDGSLTFTFKNFNFTTYGTAFNATIDLGVECRNATNSGRVRIPIPSRPLPSAEKPLAVTLDRKVGTPIMKINGKPFFPVMMTCYNYNDASVEKSSPTGYEGKNSPVNVCAVRFGGSRDRWWVGDNEYDFEAADRVFKFAMENYPEAKIMVWLWCQPGDWYGKKYPERMARNNKNAVWDYYVSAVTFSGEAYRRDAERAVQKFVEYAEKHYGNKIIAYSLCGGVSCEWQAWDAHQSHNKGTMFDYGETAKKDFKAFVENRYGKNEPTAIPTLQERLAAGNATFRDPVKNRTAIRYDDYFSEAIAGCIDRLARAIKRQLGSTQKLVGAYYGYILEYSIYNWCVNLGGHNAPYQLMTSPAMDMFFSPPSYTVRDIGFPSAEMKLYGSIGFHGKYSILEDDTRTSLTAFEGVQGHHPVTDAHTYAILRRNWGMALSRQTPICMLPLVEGRDYDSPIAKADMREAGKAGQWLFEVKHNSGVETAFVVDEKSMKYLAMTTKRDVEADPMFYYDGSGKLNRANRNSQRLSGPLYGYQLVQLSQFGAGVDVLELDDVPALAGNYKLWIFSASFFNDSRLQKAIAELSKHPVTIVVLYGSGFMTDKAICDTNAMSKLLGMQIKQTTAGATRMKYVGGKEEIGMLSATEPRFAVNDPQAKVLACYKDNNAPAMASKKLGKATLIFCGSPAITEQFIATTLKSAGGHLYTVPGDVVFAGYGVVTLHSKTKGEKVLNFPAKVDVYDVFNKKVVARNVTTYRFKMNALETRVFLTGTPEEIAKLK